MHRLREWDAVATTAAPGLEGTRACFVVLPGGRMLVEEGDVADAAPLARPLGLRPPFRAWARRRDGGDWVVGARAIDVVALAADVAGEEVEIAWDGLELTVRVDGELSPLRVEELEALGAARHDAYVVQAYRLEGATWEIVVSPL